jgi:hypothetical protein
MREIYSVAEELLASQEKVCSMELVAYSIFLRYETDI